MIAALWHAPPGGINQPPCSDRARRDASGKLGLMEEWHAVVCTDEYATVPWLHPRGHVLERFDVIVDAAPHCRYRALELKWPFIDIWNLVGRGGLVQKPPGPVLVRVR